MSGGERQALAIARALYFGARLLILDEPTAALGVKEARIVIDLIKTARAKGIALVFITHNATHALAVGDRFTVLIQGRVASQFLQGEKSREEVLNLMAGGEEFDADRAWRLSGMRGKDSMDDVVLRRHDQGHGRERLRAGRGGIRAQLHRAPRRRRGLRRRPSRAARSSTSGAAWPRPARRGSEDTLQVIYSGTKGLMASCMLILIERGLIDLDAPVAKYWPEFAANGKEDGAGAPRRLASRGPAGHRLAAARPSMTSPITRRWRDCSPRRRCPPIRRPITAITR